MSESFEKENLNNEVPKSEDVQEVAPQSENESVVAESTIFVKHVYNTKKPAKNGSKKRILICAIAAVLCGAIIGGVFLIQKFVPDADTGSSELVSSIPEQESFAVIKYSDIVKDSTISVDGNQVEVDTNIKSVRFVNGLEEFTCLPYFVKAEKEETTASGDTSSTEKKTYLYDTNWCVDGIDKEKTVSGAIYQRIQECLTINAIKKMENTFGSVAEYHNYYGMNEKLIASCVVTFSDGTPDLIIYVGSALATGDSFYFRTSLSDDVYVVESAYAEYFRCSSKEFACSFVIDKLEYQDKNKAYYNDNKQLARFDSIKLSGTVFGDKTYEFKMATGASADYMPYLMISPYKRPASDKFIADILGLVDEGLEASMLYSYSITDKDIKECGFDKPQCVIEFKISDYTYKMTIGNINTMSQDNESNSVAMAIVEGKDMVFGIDVNEIASIINAGSKITTMFNQNFIMEDIYTVKSLEMKVAEGQYKFDLTHTLRDGQTNVYDTVVKKGSTVMDTQPFKLIYQRVLMLSLMDFVTEAEHTTPVLTVNFNFIEGGQPKVVEFTESPDDIYHYIAWVDGTPLGEVMKSSVTDVIDCLNKYLSGEAVPDTW